MVLPSFYDKKSYSFSCLANVQFILQMILSDPHKALIIYWLFFLQITSLLYIILSLANIVIQII